MSEWRRTVWTPRSLILRALPRAGTGLVSALLAINVALGLLPAAFIVASSVLLGRIHANLSAGPGAPFFRELALLFVLAAVVFLAQHCLVPLQGVLGERLKRRVDGLVLDEIVCVSLQSTGLAPMEDGETTNALSEATRQFDEGWNTPGMACAGLLALVARYVRLAALLAVITAVAAWSSAVLVGAATLLLRHGQRGGLRKYSSVWREIAHLTRRSRYLRELAMGAPAAKEIRIFGLSAWLTAAYAAAHRAVYEPVAARRRRVYLKPFLVYVPCAFALAAVVFLRLVRSADAGESSLTELAIGLQAALGALLLGEYYVEADVPTEQGTRALAALREARQRIAAFEVPQARERLPVEASVPARCLRLEALQFHYPGSEQRPVMTGLSLDLAVGKCTAIVGVNGAGKTTLVKLLARLYEPHGGSIRADGVDISRFDPAAWRRQISVIFQDFVRYELSAADNIALGAVHVPRDMAAVRRAAERAGILEVLESLPLGLDTPLARAYSGGADLSGGQWQRIAIARSLYALNAGARLLVLDEPTAALDVRAEAAFFDRFVELTRGATSLLISHRFSSVRRADFIAVVDAGRVVEQGTHAELLAAEGQYARLFRLQAARFAGDAAGAALAVQESDVAEVGRRAS